MTAAGGQPGARPAVGAPLKTEAPPENCFTFAPGPEKLLDYDGY
jgi:hypothetical protein